MIKQVIVGVVPWDKHGPEYDAATRFLAVRFDGKQCRSCDFNPCGICVLYQHVLPFRDLRYGKCIEEFGE